MKLVRFGSIGKEKPGMVDENGDLRDISELVDDVNAALLSDEAKLNAIRALDVTTLEKVASAPMAPDTWPRLAPCVADVGKMVCIGLNYYDHAAEVGREVPKEMMVFFKATSCISGPYDNVPIPIGAKSVDWEVELGVVIGKKAKYVSKEDAIEYVAGYCIVNDVSERDFQKTSGEARAKSCDGFGPIGPCVVTKDEVPDPQNLSMTTHVNGVRMQNGTTKTMIFPVAEIIAYLSSFFTLYPGHIISTGTPPGVGVGMKPSPVFLKAGDVMELRIDKLGMQRQTVTHD